MIYMRIRFCLTFALLTISSILFAQSNRLFKIVDNGKIGYINEKGGIEIPTKFNNGKDFSEGLASVRLNGRYGFIDKSGNFVIQPKYDFATSFINGIACVYMNGNPIYINKNEINALDTIFQSIHSIRNHKVIVRTKTEKVGIFDSTTKKLLVDTIYKSITPYNTGIMIVRDKVKNKDNNNYKERFAVMDSLGSVIVNFSKYDKIYDFNEGFARVEFKDTNDNYENINGVIDVKGNLLFQSPQKNNNIIDKDFYNGLAVVDLYEYWQPEINGVISNSIKKGYQGYINLKGEVVLNDTNNTYLKRFSNNRAFIHDKKGKYIIIDTKIQPVGNEVFDDVQDNGFKKGYAIVEKNYNWGIIDTFGKFIIDPKFEFIHKLGVIDGYFFYGLYGNDNNKYYGISTIKGENIISPIIQDFDQSGFVNGILKAIIDNRLTYIDKLGNIIWQEKKAENIKLMTLNIDCMNRGYFYAYSRPNNKYKRRFEGGFGESRNLPKIITSENFPKKQLSVTVDSITQDTFQNKFIGYKVFVANKSKKIIAFNAQDSRLKMKVQALNENGIWRDIEYLPSSWCGNSYHTLTLNKNNYWTFITPKYEGEIKTRFRVELKYLDPNDKSEKRRDQTEITIYSNEYEGSINPAQFWNKIQYFSNGLMDPYND